MAENWKSTEEIYKLVSRSKNSQNKEISYLLSARAVRERCHEIGRIAEAGNANWFTINETHFKRCVALVAQNCKKNYPDLKIPSHSRWHHFLVGEINLWDHHTGNFSGDRKDLARSAVDLMFISVLLDAGAGNTWRYTDPVSGQLLSRSEGLAAVSVEFFFNHATQYDERRGWCLDSEKLHKIDYETLSKIFQTGPDNQIIGLERRLKLLHRLADVLNNVSADQDVAARPGSIVDECIRCSKHSVVLRRQVDATQILDIILRQYGEIWPSGVVHEGVFLGDCGFHPLIQTTDSTSGIVPFHKLSQWLVYSLVVPLEMAGLAVSNLNGLTALPEYRNGGLLIDTGTLQPLDLGIFDSTFIPDSEAVVEWRALTVYIIDRLAKELRQRLKLNSKNLALGAVLQGGTWSAGRELAQRLRPDGAPPLNINMEGTVF